MERRGALISLTGVILFAVIMHRPIFFDGKTVSAFDLAYRWGAYAGARPAALGRAANGLLSDPVVQFQAWDVAMFDGSLRFPWLWNPHAGFGSPLLANSQSAPLFPLKLTVYSIFGARMGFGVVAFLKMALAGTLMWLYLRKLGLDPVPQAVGSLAFMACGFMVAWLQWPHTNVAIFLPWFFYGVECLLNGEHFRGWASVAAATALGALGGHPETFFHVAMTSGMYLVTRVLLCPRRTPGAAQPGLTRLMALFLAAGITGALLAAIQLFPTAEYIQHSAALEGRSVTTPSTPSLTTLLSWGDSEYIRREFLTYLLPDTFGNPSLHTSWWNKFSNYNESAGYVGIGTFALALFSWRYWMISPVVRPLLAIQAFALGFVLRLPIVCNTIGTIPPLSVAANKRFLLVFCFCNAALAAVAVQEWRRSRRWTVSDAAILGLIVVLLSALAIRRYFTAFAGHAQSWIQAYGRRGLLHFCLFLLLAMLALAFMRSRNRRVSAAAAFALPLIVAVDLNLIHFGYNPFIAPELIYPSTRAIEFLQAQTGQRVLPIHDHIGPNIPTAYGLDDPRLYDALTYWPLSRYLSGLQAVPGWYLVRQAPSRLTSTAGIGYLWAGANWSPSTASARLAYSHGEDRIYEDAAARPVAYVASTWKSADRAETALEMLKQSDGDTTLTVVEGAPAGGTSPPQIRMANVVRPSATRVLIDLPDSAAGLLVLNDCYFPGWTARVDARPVRIYRTNGTFRGVFLTPGSRRVEFTFKPLSFVAGATVTATTFFLLLLATVLHWRRFRRRCSLTQLQLHRTDLP